MATIYRASKNRSQNREGWCALFHHPLRRNEKGKPLRIRRGLGTKDDAEADRLVEQLNQLLQDESFWSVSQKGRASRDLDHRIVSMFFDDIESRALEDPWSDRDNEMPLPGPEQGYARVQLVGTTGAGKTTLLRQLIGSDPIKDRFPSTSTAKTTTFDLEIICDEGLYRAVVSFLSRERVRLYVEECVMAGAISAIEGEDRQNVLRHLLEHNDQRFRLNYILGNAELESRGNDEDAEDLVDDDSFNDDTDDFDDESITDVDRMKMQTLLTSFLDRLIGLAETESQRNADGLGITLNDLAREERDAFIDLCEQAMRENEEIQQLIDEILDEVESRFDQLEAKEASGNSWPTVWRYQTNSRVAFIKTINRLSSNYARHFGTLLTPLVQGMRVAGPFRPTWAENAAVQNLVIIDGEGLGHTPDSAFSLPTSITKRFDKVDAIALVDNSAQPIQAGAQAVLRSVAVSGHASKLAIVFTHFDQVKGDNLPDQPAKKNHVLASLDNALGGLSQVFGDNVARALQRNLEGKVFFVSNIQEKLSPGARFTKNELAKLIESVRSSIAPMSAGEAIPTFDLAKLVLRVRKANEQFNDYWMARLRLKYKIGVDAEHWTRIKALSRRYAEQWEDHYDNLRPVADMIRFTSEAMTTFINNPRSWKGPATADEEKELRLGKVSQEFFSRLHVLAQKRLFLEHVAEWVEAYDRRGKGSTIERAKDIRNIYEDAAPIPGESSEEEPSNKLLDSIAEIFIESADAAGAEVLNAR